MLGEGTRREGTERDPGEQTNRARVRDRGQETETFTETTQYRQECGEEMKKAGKKEKK